MRALRLALAVVAVLVVGCPKRTSEAARPGRPIAMPEFTEAELVAAPALGVAAATPQGQLDEASAADEVAVTFDAPMIALGEEVDSCAFPLLLEPDVAGRCRWLGDRTIVFAPDSGFVSATRYSVRIPRGVRAAEGEMLKSDYRFEFLTVRPTLERSDPYHERDFVRIDRPLWLLFNLPMDPKRAARGISLRGPAGLDVAVRVRHPRPGEMPEESWWYDSSQASRTLVVEPRRRLAIESPYVLRLSPELRAAQGDLGLAEARGVEFRTFKRLRLEGIVDAGAHYPEDAVELVFSNPVPVAMVARDIQFIPPVKIPEEFRNYDWATTEVRMSLPLSPETQYEVRLSRWVSDKFGNRLGRGQKLKLRTVSYRPRASMPTGPGVIESEGKPFHPVTMVNIESLAVRTRRLGTDEVVPYWRAVYDYNYYESEDGKGRAKPFERPGFYTHERLWRPRLERNKRTVLPLDVGKGLAGGTGIVACELDALFEPERGSRFHRALLQVTPYGITAKFAPEVGLGLVTRLADASAVPNLAVQVRDDRNRVLWTGRTRADGTVALPGWDALGATRRNQWDNPRLWLFAGDQSAAAFVHSDWGTGIEPYEFGIPYDWNPDPAEPRGFIFTDKGLYKGGDTVRLKGIIRYKKLGNWVVPQAREGKLTVTDPMDEKLLAVPVRLSGNGTFDLAVALGPEAHTGYYPVQFELGGHDFSGYFRVEAYRPAEFDVKVDAGRESWFAGEEFSATVRGEYLFGAPMSGDRVSWSAALAPTGFTPPGFSDYSFDADREGAAFARVGSGSGKLDERGSFAVSARLKPARPVGAYTLSLEAEVTAPNERTGAGRGSWLVHSSSAYIGVKSLRRFVAAGESLAFDAVVVSPEGKPLEGTGVVVTVLRREWKSARKAGTGGRYSWVNDYHDVKVKTLRLKSEAGPVRSSFRPDKPGSYRLRLEARDRSRRPAVTDFPFWVSGAGEAAWLQRDDDMVELLRDREQYKPGDTARIMVMSPWQNVRALVTVERENVMDHFIVPLGSTAGAIKVPVKPEYLPNVFVSVVLIKGRTANSGFSEAGDDLGKPGIKIGYVELPVDPESKRLDVRVAADRPEYRPRGRVKLDLAVKDNSGAGRRAEVTVAVVDLGVLKLTGYATPDPFGLFYARRPLSVATAESRLHVIGQRNYGEKGEAQAGDGIRLVGASKSGEGYEFAFREKFLETALWLPAVETDEAGRAQVEFELPDNLTQWQVMAVAVAGDRFGSADTQFRSNKPLLIAPSLPRFCRPEDEFDAGVTVHNRTEKPMSVTVRAAVGAGVELSGESRKTVAVEPNRAVEVRFRYRCTGGDRAHFEFTAEAGSERDGLKLSIPVRMPLAIEAAAVYENTDSAGARHWVEVPADALDGVGGLEVTLSSSGLAGLERGLEWLRTYPYECLEQRLSKILPFIVGERVVNDFGLSELRGTALREFVGGELAKVPRYQDASGGFTFWAGSGERVSPWLSAYCMDVLARARQAGYSVDARVVDRGVAYLSGWLGGRDSLGAWPYELDERLSVRALAVLALARLGQRPMSDLNALAERRDQMSVYGRACLLDAATVLGAERLKTELARDFDNLVKLTPTTAHYEESREGGWLFYSNVRTTALVLQALLAARGRYEFADNAVKWLVTERRSGRWRTTQENAAVFGALAAFYRSYESVRPEFRATVELEGRSIVEALFSGRSLAMERRFVPVAELKRGERQAVSIERTGAGRLYYGLRLSFCPRRDPGPQDAGFHVEKTVKPLEGKTRGYARGALYLVTLTIATSQDRLFAVVDDPLPAGFEIVNTSFETESRGSAGRLAEVQAAEGGWWGGFDHEEKRDDRFLLFATYLRRGLHKRTYLVRALTPGRFLMPATRAEEMYAPEVWGRTGQQWVDVK